MPAVLRSGESRCLVPACWPYAVQVERLLGSVDALVYMLDYTKPDTNDEEELFRGLAEANPSLARYLSQRLFFVVNKVRRYLLQLGVKCMHAGQWP